MLYFQPSSHVTTAMTISASEHDSMMIWIWFASQAVITAGVSSSATVKFTTPSGDTTTGKDV